MNSAVVLATDRGEALRPMTNEATPTAFLALGDRRSLLRQWVDRLGELDSIEPVGVVIDAAFREPAASVLPEMICVIPTLADLDLDVAESDAVLLQPAEQAIRDPEAYGRIVTDGLARAASEGVPIAFTSQSEGGNVRKTGIEAWPSAQLHRARFATDSSGSVAECRTLGLDDAGWIDLTDWDGIQRLLSYVEKPWGYERLWALNRHYAGKILFIRAGESLSLQYHEIKDETIRIDSGRMRFRVGPSADELETVILEPGMSYPIPTGRVHQMEAIEDCTVFEVSTPHLTDVVRLEDRYGRTIET